MAPAHSTLSHEATSSPDYDWTTSSGQSRLKDITQPRLPYTLSDFQPQNTARLLVGQDVLLVSATGDGKTAIIYLYCMVRPETVNIIVSPTNALESDMVTNFERLGIQAVALNSESLARAALQDRDLWAEVQACKYQAVFVSPELLSTARFRNLVQHETVRSRLGLLAIDEIHLVDEWGKDFREAYRAIKLVRPWLPESTVMLGLTATLEPGAQTKRVIASAGFRRGYHLERRDCARHNVDIVIRTISHAYTTNEFHDLDWLVPPDITKPSDIPKTLIYCETIDLGHRVASYLRSLLPTRLSSKSHRIIRHYHSMNCAECKEEGHAALYESDEDREAGLYIATDVLGAGMNMPDFDRVICFVTPSSAAALIQRIGRTSRARDRHGVAYVYIKKSDIESVEKYLQQPTLFNLDSRLLRTPVIGPLPPDTILTPTNQGNAIHEDDDLEFQPRPVLVGRSFGRKTATTRETISGGSAKPQMCPSLRLILAAHCLGACVSRQINIIYQNPDVDTNCGRCSSCQPRDIPSPRAPTVVSSPSVIPPDNSVPPKPSWKKMNAADTTTAISKLQKAAFSVQRKIPRNDDFICITSASFLPLIYIRRILDDFLAVTSKDVLGARMEGWPYWDEAGSALWEEVDQLRVEMEAIVTHRREEALAKQRENYRKKKDDEQQVRTALADAGLGNVRRVILRVNEPSITSSATAKENEGASSRGMVASDTLPLYSGIEETHATITSPSKSTSVPPTSPTSRSPKRKATVDSPLSPSKQKRRLRAHHK